MKKSQLYEHLLTILSNQSIDLNNAKIYVQTALSVLRDQGYIDNFQLIERTNNKLTVQVSYSFNFNWLEIDLDMNNIESDLIVYGIMYS